MDKGERMNLFRRFFAFSRYNRLLIQQNLVRTSTNSSLGGTVLELERRHSQDFVQFMETITAQGYRDEFLQAAKEEEEALQKIIEAYDKRMNR